MFSFAVNEAHIKLPERVASHFDFGGRADGWMVRDQLVHQFVWLAIVFAAWLPLLAACFFFVPVQALNIPSRMKAIPKAELSIYLLFQSFWGATLAILFWAAQLFIVIQANHQQPPSVMTGLIVASASTFVAGLIVVFICTYRFFPRVEANKPLFS